MRQLFSFLVLSIVALIAGGCHCKTCYVGGPGECCLACPEPPKPLKGPKVKPRCEYPRWPERPVKCVTTQICRKCCHYECAATCEGYEFKIEVCEITYKSLYTDGSSKIWTEVSRNPIIPTAAGKSFQTTYPGWKTKAPVRYSIVGDRRDDCGSFQAKVQHLDKHVEKAVCEAAAQARAAVEDTGEAFHVEEKAGSEIAQRWTAGQKAPTTIWRRSEG